MPQSQRYARPPGCGATEKGEGAYMRVLRKVSRRRSARNGLDKAPMLQLEGKPCEAYAITDGTVCRGSWWRAPQVRAAAHRRIIQAQITAGLLAGQMKATRRRDALGDFDFR
ncbi:MAG TPA: hypothetical protein VHY21_13090 [Pseudonocardiaceae bacterium]|nr:hypothetical protein [Pseudonocardiaceae bacterium]